MSDVRVARPTVRAATPALISNALNPRLSFSFSLTPSQAVAQQGDCTRARPQPLHRDCMLRVDSAIRHPAVADHSTAGWRRCSTSAPAWAAACRVGQDSGSRVAHSDVAGCC